MKDLSLTRLPINQYFNVSLDGDLENIVDNISDNVITYLNKYYQERYGLDDNRIKILPESLGRMRKLEFLSLRRNGVSAPIPDLSYIKEVILR